MKLYGSRARDMQTCRYGCCGSSPLSLARCRGGKPERACRKAAKHRARREGRKVEAAE
jgi:hypothetical protein